MKRFFALLQRLRQADPPAAKAPPVEPDRADRSSLADLVRILQEQDRRQEMEDA